MSNQIIIIRKLQHHWMTQANPEWGWHIEYPEGYNMHRRVTHASWSNAFSAVRARTRIGDVILVQLDEQSPLQELDDVLELMLHLKYGMWMKKIYEYFSLDNSKELDAKVARAKAVMPFYIMQWENNDFRLRIPYIAFNQVRLMSMRQLERETGRAFRWKSKKRGLNFDQQMIVYRDLCEAWADLPLHARLGGSVTEPITVQVDPLDLDNPDRLIMFLKYRP